MAPDSSSPGKTDGFEDRDRLILALKQLQDAYSRQSEIIERYDRLYHDMKKPREDVLEELEEQRELNRTLARQLLEMQEDFEAQKEELQSRMEELQFLLEQEAGIEASAVRSERDFRAIVEKNADAMVVLDGEGRVLYTNPAAEALFNLSSEDMVGAPFGHPIVLERPAQMLVIRQFKSFIHVEMRLVEVTWGGKPSYLISLRDMTDRIKAERALNHTKGDLEKALLRKNVQFKKALDSLDDAFTIFNSDWRYVYVNDAAAKVAGMPKGQMLGKNTWKLFPRSVGTYQYEQFMKTMEDKTPRAWTNHSDISDTWQEYRAIPWENGIAIIARDITERRQAEEALRESEARIKVAEAIEVERRRLFGVLETVPAMICLLTPDYHIAFANRSFREKFGDPHGRRCYECCFGRSEPCEFCESYTVLKTGQPHHWEVRGPDGSMIECHDYPFTDVDGSPMILEMDVDITVRKKAEETARLAYAYNRSLIEASLDPLVTISPEGGITDVNRATEEITGLSREQLIGTDFSEYFIEPEKAREGYLKVFKEGSVKDYPLEVRHLDGEVTPVNYNASVYRDEDGKVIGVFAAARDITERKKAEVMLRDLNETLERNIAELREAEKNVSAERQRFNDVLETLPAYLILLTPDYHVPFANRFFRERFGESHGRRCYEYLFGRTEPCESCETFKILKTGAPHRWEWTGPDGRNYDIYDYPFKDTDGSPLIMEMGIDITERKKAEIALKELNETLERLVAERTGEFNEAKIQAELYLDLMGHDINNMHQIALGYLELARDMPPGGEQTTFLDKPVEVLQRSAMLISNVRKLQKLKDGVFQTQDVDVCQVLSGIRREFGAVPHKTVTLNMNGLKSCPVHANELLHDVFSNLVGNAIKHTGDRANITVDLDVVKSDGARYCRVTVEDDGRGIPDEHKDTIFNRKLKGAGKVKGMGLGLYLVRSLVDSYGGRVWAEDRVKGDHAHGARFVVMLPAIEK